MSLLPSEPDTEPPKSSPRVIGVDSEDAEDVLAALSSGTARELLSALHEQPAPPSRLADQVDTSLQNAQYHLEKLETAGAVEVVDTAYSEKGREMDVYAPADQPLVIFAGDEGESTLRSALSRLLGSVGVLAVASLAVQAVFGENGLSLGGGGEDAGAAGGAGTATPEAAGDGAAGGGAGGVAPTPTPETTDGGVGIQSTGETETSVEVVTEAARTATRTTEEAFRAATTTEEPVRAAAEAAGSGALPPGLVFFAGGLVAVAVVGVALALR
jgi:DNA-binding transcriptional ArsR family regulator